MHYGDIIVICTELLQIDITALGFCVIERPHSLLQQYFSPFLRNNITLYNQTVPLKINRSNAPK